MSLPLPFFFGVALILLDGVLDSAVPTGKSWWNLAPFAVVILLPPLAARVIGNALHTRLLRRGRLTRTDGILARVPEALVVACFGILVFVAEWPRHVEPLGANSTLLYQTVLLLPLVTMEILVRLVERRTELRFEKFAGRGLAPLGPSRLAMTAFVLLPLLMFALLADLAFLDRRMEVFFASTSLGSTLGLALAVLILCAGLPLFFRWTLPTSRTLPADVASDVRETARALEFPPDRILALRSRLRIVNAALVGPLRWPRYLVLSDGLIELLRRDILSLRGVIAHEIGHARAGHPALLLIVFVGIPVLLLHPISSVDAAVFESEVVLLSVGVVLAFGLVFVLRRIAHRFEFEADEHSARALGGVEPCVNALRRVGELSSPGHRYKSSYRHPSEHERVVHLVKWAQDPEYRARSASRGRALRVVILVATVAALGVSAFAHARTWPLDRAIYALYSGDFATAQSLLEKLPADPPLVSESLLAELRAEANAAVELVGPGAPGAWNTLRPRLAHAAWQRGLAVLSTGDATGATPWFALAIGDRDDSPLERLLYLLCAAQRDGDRDEFDLLRANALARSDLPPDLGAALRALTPPAPETR